ncbi:hypothetical protein DFJ74DRAFT_772701 [Hyaloraphidium curvatum]|nr:hypothetical protein DFJ74DRAFT_772701 [Hyaloraphidium curvatum]
MAPTSFLRRALLAAAASLALVPAASAFVEGTFTAASGPAVNATTVTVGLYAANAYEILPNSNTFYFSGYMWLRWPATLENEPAASFEIINSVDSWGLTLTPISENATIFSNGEAGKQFKVQGRFFQPFQMSSYPLDSQTLDIVIEDTDMTADKIYYVADREMSGKDVSFQLPGWKITGMTFAEQLHDYKTNFGDPDNANANLFSAVKISIAIERQAQLFAFKLLIPLILVLITGWLALVLNPRYIEVRTAMCATALLTTVFLQQSASDPSQTTSLTMMDTIFIVIYCVIVITFAQVIWDNNRMNKVMHPGAHHGPMAPTGLMEIKTVDRKADGEVEAIKKDVEAAVNGAPAVSAADDDYSEHPTVKSIRKWDLISLVVQVIVTIIVITVLVVTLS